MSYSFELENNEIIEEEDVTKTSFPNYATDLIYCPKCGAENIPPRNVSYTQNYFCSRCSIKLNDIWEGLNRGIIRLVNCEQCILPTFAEYKFCINCSRKQKSVAKKQSEAISKEMPMSSILTDERSISSFSRIVGQTSLLGVIISLTILFVLGAIFLHMFAFSFSNNWLILATIFDILSLTGIITSVILYKSLKSKK